MKNSYFDNKPIASIPSIWTYYILLMLATLIFFAPLSYSNSKLNKLTDFDQHLQWALDLKAGKAIPAYVLAHSGWQFLLIFVNTITGLSFRNASFAGTLLCWFGTLTVLYWWVLPIFIRNKIPLYTGILIILGVSVTAPISLLWFWDGLMYLGYIGITSYHNPTILLLKPFALLQFIFAYQILEGRQFSIGKILIIGLTSLLGTFVKPSLAICILPALAIIVFQRLYTRNPVNLRAFLFGMVIPTGIILAWQFSLTYFEKDLATVVFMPFAVMNLYSEYLLPKFILSVSFPLFVVIAYPKATMADTRMVLSWLTFGFSLFLTYFLAEGGKRFRDSNFTWSGEIALFLLFVVSTFFFLDQSKDLSIKNRILRFAWVGHVISGIIYYFFCFYVKVYR